MARRPRIESAGYHHIYNRGVEKRIVFAETEDKDKFLQIVCEISKHYDFIIHQYVVMDNHYHILLENKRENLSAGMRQINSTYAQYFNKKYKRVGHLWQDRFKSWYVFDEEYLFTIFKYLEFNPIKAKISKKVGEFPYTILHDILNGKLKECMKDSFIFTWYGDTSGLLESFDIDMSKKEYDKIEQFQKFSTAYKSESKKMKQKLNLKKYFQKDLPKYKRDEQILRAAKDGFAQSEIANFLKLSNSRVSRIVKRQKANPDPVMERE